MNVIIGFFALIGALITFFVLIDRVDFYLTNKRINKRWKK